MTADVSFDMIFQKREGRVFMAAFNQKQKYVTLVICFVAGLALGFSVFGGREGAAKLLALVPAVTGAGIGRLVYGVMTGRQLKKYNAILFEQVKPREFLEAFQPVAAAMPKNSLDYVESCNKLAYAHEALGRFEKSLEILEALEPETLKRKAVGAMATTYSNRVRVKLLSGNEEGAREALEQLRGVMAACGKKNASLAKSLATYIRLYENWLLVLSGQEADTEYLQLEVDRSMNRIRKSEMQLLLARAWEIAGDPEQADELRIETLSTGLGLWGEQEARRLLNAKK